jgi:hypothetical protein
LNSNKFSSTSNTGKNFIIYFFIWVYFLFYAIVGAASLIDELRLQIRSGTLFKNKSGSVNSKTTNSGLQASDETVKSESINSIAAIEKAIDKRFSSQVEVNFNADMPEWKKQLLEKKKLHQN